MARSSIRVGIRSRARIRARALAKFPAQVIAGDGISIAQAGGVFTFSIDPDHALFDAFVTLHGVETISNKTFSSLTTITLNGNALPAANPGTALQIGGANAANAVAAMDAFGGISIFDFRRANGTAVARTAVQSGDILSGLSTWGYDGSAYVLGVSVNASAAQAWTGSAHGSRLRIGTIANNSTTYTERLGIEDDGGLVVPPTVTGGSKGDGTLNVSGNYYVDGAALENVTQTLTNKTLTAPVITTPAIATASFTGLSTFTRADNEAIVVRSGNNANYTYIGIGRGGGNEFALGIAAGANQFMTGTLAGEAAINANNALWLGAGNAPGIRVGAAGALRFSALAAGVLHADSSGNVTSSGIAVGDFAATTANRLFGSNGAGIGALISLPGAGLLLSGGTLVLNNDVAALEALSGTGIARRTGADAWSVGTTVSVAEGGTGATTLTGVLNGNGTGAVTAITDAGTVGRVLRVTGANAFAFGALDLANANAVTGDLPLTSIAQIPARSLLGNTSGSTGDIGAFTIGSLTQKLTPAGTDLVLIQDQAASGALKYATVTAVAAAAGAGDFVGPGSATDNAVLRFDGTTGKLGQNSGVLIDDASNIVPATNDVGALGTTSLKWADAFFASGAVLNFNSGDVTVTHGSNALAFAGASSGYAFDAPLDISGAAAGQIRFPATQNASANANTLDDYEEGTWTPTGNGVTFAAASGSYTKIGRHVFVDFQVTWPSTANVNAALIGSLPFTVGSDNGAGSVGFQSGGASNSVITINAASHPQGSAGRSQPTYQRRISFGVRVISTDALTRTISRHPKVLEKYSLKSRRLGEPSGPWGNRREQDKRRHVDADLDRCAYHV